MNLVYLISLRIHAQFHLTVDLEINFIIQLGKDCSGITVAKI